ncbi:MAG TPA: C1 family peptidase, partial [Candidatus Sumerlaeota bacterium]|nr:C1 family peptidase [Candidatus Sumerlaeota bacterium]
MKSYQTTLLLTIIMALLAGMGFAQDSASLTRAPLNPDFIQYVKEREEGKIITRTRDGYPLMDIPPTLDMNRGVGQWVFPGKSEADLPASYDLRTLSRLTSVKDQKACGSCWTFAT